jgi:hypothetical protein
MLKAIVDAGDRRRKLRFDKGEACFEEGQAALP